LFVHLWKREILKVDADERWRKLRK